MSSHSHTLARLNQLQRQVYLELTGSQAPRTNRGLEVGPVSAQGAWSLNHSKLQGSQLSVTDQGQIAPPLEQWPRLCPHPPRDSLSRWVFCML